MGKGINCAATAGRRGGQQGLPPTTTTATKMIHITAGLWLLLVGVVPPANAFALQSPTGQYRALRRHTNTAPTQLLLLSLSSSSMVETPPETTKVTKNTAAAAAAAAAADVERRELQMVVSNNNKNNKSSINEAAKAAAAATISNTALRLGSAAAGTGTSSVTTSTTTSTTTTTSLEYNTNVGWLEQILNSYWGVRAVLMIIPAIYGTNFALGSSLNEALANPALTTALRMTLASLAVLPWLVRIDVKKLLLPAIFTGLCSATGYIGQSIALNDVDPARVSFLGAAVVVWCPILEALFDRRPFTAQTYIAAGLCMTGVAILENVVGSTTGVASALTFASGDAWALLQAIGFGTQCYLCSKFITDDNKDQVIPFTAVLVTVTAVTAWFWYGLTMSTGDPMTSSGLSLQSIPSSVWLALAWTGLISTSANFALEVAALGRVQSSEATVFLSTEPIWAAIFASMLLGNTMTSNEYVGGSLMILACLAGSVSLDDVKGFVSRAENRLKLPPDEYTARR